MIGLIDIITSLLLLNLSEISYKIAIILFKNFYLYSVDINSIIPLTNVSPVTEFL